MKYNVPFTFCRFLYTAPILAASSLFSPGLFAAQPFEISEHTARISAAGFERVIALTNGNVSTIRLRVNGQELLAGPAPEFSVTITRAEPNARPSGLKPGEGGSIDSVKTFRPGQHIEPGAFDDAACPRPPTTIGIGGAS